MKLGRCEVRDFGTPYIIAEIGSNHNGDMVLAKKMIDAAKDCGCDAVKFQSWSPETLVSREEYDRNQKYTDSPKKHFGSLREMVEKYYLRPEQHWELKEYCDAHDMEFLSTPFAYEEVDLLEALKVSFYKIASMDVTNLELLKYVAGKNKPVVLATGMATLSEIERAVRTIESSGNHQIILLHCIAVYPPVYDDIHLNNIPMLRQVFGYSVGFSDHSKGIAVPMASVALGSCLIEKHFTLDKDLPGWDHEISADPGEMKAIVEGARCVARSMGSFQRTVGAAEQAKKTRFRRSIVVKKAKKEGDILRIDDVTFKRPETGVRPDELMYVLGRRLKKDVQADDVIHWDNLI